MKSPFWKKIWSISLCGTALCAPLYAGGNLTMHMPSRAPASFPAPLGDSVYADIDRLAAFGVLESHVIGQRPWTAHEVARLLDEAATLLDARVGAPTVPRDRVERIIARNRTHIAPWLGDGRWLHPVQQISADVTWHDQPERRILYDNNLAPVIAEERSFRNYQNAAPDLQGVSHAIGLQSAARLDRRATCALDATWRAGYDAAGRDIDSRVGLHMARCQLVLGGVELSVGREPVAWGQSDGGGLLLSTNARPLDHIRLSSAHPFYHPWLLRYLGPSKYTLVVAQMSDNPSIPHPTFIGATASIRPHRRFEFGFYHTYIMGGRGGPDYNWYDPLTEFVFVRAPGSTIFDPNLADHRAGINMRWDIPGLRGTAIYAEGAFEDFGRANFLSNVLDMSGYILGLHLPRLDAEGRWGMRLEYRDIPAILYRHGIYQQGHTNADRLLGDALGPDGRSLRLRVDREWNARHRSAVSLWGELLDSDTYVQTTTSAGIPNRVVSVADNPSQLRLRAELTHRWQLTPQLELGARLAHQYVRGDNFTPGQMRQDFLTSAQIQWRPKQ